MLRIQGGYAAELKRPAKCRGVIGRTLGRNRKSTMPFETPVGTSASEDCKNKGRAWGKRGDVILVKLAE